jgi:hypothetical protein
VPSLFVASGASPSNRVGVQIPASAPHSNTPIHSRFSGDTCASAEYFGKSRTARGNRNCRLKCPIHVEGSLGGEEIRKGIDLTSWEAGSNLITQWNA